MDETTVIALLCILAVVLIASVVAVACYRLGYADGESAGLRGAELRRQSEGCTR